MNRFVKWGLIVLGVLLLGVVLMFVFGGDYMKSLTKKASPETTINYQKGGLDLSVYYNRPSKKERVIFGELVPFGQVWRTGANEPTTFTTQKDLLVNGQPLPAGKYTLWTIPNQQDWTVIFNEKAYDWGVTFKDFKVVASHDPSGDVLKVNVPTNTLGSVVEQFTIAFEEQPALQMVFSWDQTKVAVPISLTGQVPAMTTESSQN